MNGLFRNQSFFCIFTHPKLRNVFLTIKSKYNFINQTGACVQSFENDFEKYVYVKESGIHGKGLFTCVRIEEGKTIMVIKGEVISGDECERREDEEDNVYIFWNGDECYIDTAMTEKIKFINHKCDNNCEVADGNETSLLLVANRDIEPGEELTIDYGYEEIYEYCRCDKCVLKVAV